MQNYLKDVEPDIDFSVITVSYNSESTIKETIDSVLSQEGIKIEYIVIDGNSKDQTLSVLSEVNDPRFKYISEDDKGLYDAMNKGIAISRGEYVAIINSDDVYVNNQVLSLVYQHFNKTNADIVSGHIFYFEEFVNNIKRRFPCKSVNNKGAWRLGWQPPHPSTFVKRSVYSVVGGYHTGYTISSDYDFLLRALYVNDYKHSVLDEDLVAMRLGGESTNDFRSVIRGNKEVWKSWKRNNLRPPLKLIPYKLAYKFFKK